MSGNPVINYRTCPVNWTLDVLCTYFYVLRQGQFENVMKMTILCTLKIILHLQPYVGSKISYWNDIMILAKIKITKKFQKLVKNHYSGLFRVCPSSFTMPPTSHNEDGPINSRAPMRTHSGACDLWRFWCINMQPTLIGIKRKIFSRARRRAHEASNILLASKNDYILTVRIRIGWKFFVPLKKETMEIDGWWFIAHLILRCSRHDWSERT